MYSSYETTSFTENSPLLDKSPTPLLNYRDIPTNPRASIFSRAVLSILFTELCLQLTIGGTLRNFVYFVTDHLNMKSADASILLYVFLGAFCFLAILGGVLADSKAEKFAVILFNAFVNLLGTFFILLGSIPRINENKEIHELAYIAGFFSVAFGAGGMLVNLLPFGAEQVTNREPLGIQAFFSWFYWFTNIGTLLAITFVVYLQKNVPIIYGHLVLACTSFSALIIFLTGKQTYVRYPPNGSVFTSAINIMKEAIKRSRRPSLSSLFLDHWLDRAKLCFGGSYTSWEVEDLKKVYRLVPIFGSFVLYWTVSTQMIRSMIYQGEYMDITTSMESFGILAVLVLIPIMNKLVYPLLAKFEIRPSQLQRIGFGMVIATASIAWAGVLEWYRVKQCCMYQHRRGVHNENATLVANISILHQIPPYTLIGFSDVFTVVTGFELAYTEAPQCFQGVIMGVFLFTIGLGYFAGAALVAILNAIIEAFNGEDGKWYLDKKYSNKSHYLAYYFFLLAGLMLLNFIVYVFVALSFKKKKESASRGNGVMSVGKKPERKNEPDNGDWTFGLPAASNSAI